MNFVSRNAVFARIEHVSGHPPLSQGNLAALEYCANGDGELAFALIAVVQPGASGLAPHLGEHVGVAIATMAAEGPLGPQHGL